MNSNLDTYISDGTPERVRERYRRLSDLAKKMDFGALDENIVVIDTETTGFSFNHDELTQIACGAYGTRRSGRLVCDVRQSGKTDSR